MKLRELFTQLNEGVYPGMLWAMEQIQIGQYPEFNDRYEELKQAGQKTAARRILEEFAFWVNAQHEQKKNPRIKQLFNAYTQIRQEEKTRGEEFPRSKKRYRIVYLYYKLKLGPLGNWDEEKLKRGQEDLANLKINPNNLEHEEPELITEINLKRKPLRTSVKDSIPGMRSYDYLDNNNHPYMAYRFGIALASSPEENMYPRGPIGSDMTLVDYSTGDAEIRKGAEKLLGLKASRNTSKDSKEIPSTNTKSPVAKPKRNQYGI